jgi:AraC-like DNA-binding protein
MDWRTLSDEVSIAGISSQAIVIDRTERLAAHAVSDDIHISLQLNARGSVVQGDNVSAVAPGVITVTETNRPFTLNYIEPNQRHIVLQTTRGALGVKDEVLHHAAGRQLSGLNPARDAYVSLVTSFMAQSHPVSPEGAAEMSMLVTSLASAMLRSAWESTPALPTTAEAMHVAMVAFIRAHLTSPFLSPETIAKAHFVSRRRLYEIFEASGESPADTIRRERIERAGQILRDPSHAQLSIADMSFELGFSDVTTFTRAFKRYVGVTPSDWRLGDRAIADVSV